MCCCPLHHDEALLRMRLSSGVLECALASCSARIDSADPASLEHARPLGNSVHGQVCCCTDHYNEALLLWRISSGVLECTLASCSRPITSFATMVMGGNSRFCSAECSKKYQAKVDAKRGRVFRTCKYCSQKMSAKSIKKHEKSCKSNEARVPPVQGVCKYCSLEMAASSIWRHEKSCKANR
jgi:hypothetical protein